MTNQTNKAGQTLGIIGLVLGGLAFLISLTCVGGIIAIMPAIVAIVLSAVSLSQAKQANAPKGLSITSLVVSILATLISSIWLIFFGSLAVMSDKIDNDRFPAIEKFSDKFKNALEEEIEESIEDAMDNVDDVMENMEEKLEKLEENLDKIEDVEFDEKKEKDNKSALDKLQELEEADSTNE